MMVLKLNPECSVHIHKNSIVSQYVFSVKFPAKDLVTIVRILTFTMLLGGCMGNDGFQVVSRVVQPSKYQVSI